MEIDNSLLFSVSTFVTTADETFGAGNAVNDFQYFRYVALSNVIYNPPYT